MCGKAPEEKCNKKMHGVHMGTTCHAVGKPVEHETSIGHRQVE